MQDKDFAWRVEYRYITQSGRNEEDAAVTSAPDMLAAIGNVTKHVVSAKKPKEMLVIKAEYLGEVI